MKIANLEIVQDIVELVLKKGVFYKCLIETSMVQGNLACTKVIEQLRR